MVAFVLTTLSLARVLSRPWLVHARLDLHFPQSIEQAMALLRASCPPPSGPASLRSSAQIAPGDLVSPALRPDVPVLRWFP